MQNTVPPFYCTYSPNLPALLRALNCTLVLSAFQAGKVIFLSSKNDEELTQLPRNFAKPMGIAQQGDKLAIACLDDVKLLVNSPQLAREYPKKPGVYDALYLPRATYHTGKLDIHDMDFGENGELFAVNTAYSCLCKIDAQHSFTPIWKPNFITELRKEDRCHLNGMVLKDGRPKFVTALHDSNTPKGWRERVMDGGIVMDVESGQIIARNLPLPHSPRLFDGELFLLLSATGNLVKIEERTGKMEVVAHLDGFVRGLCRQGDYVFIGHSKLRESSSSFAKLKIAEYADTAGVSVVHLPSGEVVGEISYETSVIEIYDVQVLPGCLHPGILNTEKPAHKLGVSMPGDAFWLDKM